jgi:hypothetical protein
VTVPSAVKGKLLDQPLLELVPFFDDARNFVECLNTNEDVRVHVGLV